MITTPAFAASCESLSSLKLADTTITSAQSIAAGAFVPEAAAAATAQLFKDVPAFCRVTAEVRPSKDSAIKMEVWMPADGWNGRFEGLGNGGWAGTISVQLLAASLSRGYAVTMTDTGHAGVAGSA